MAGESTHIQYLEKDEMLSLLEIYRSELPQRRETAQNYTAIYVSLLSVIVGATVAGASLVTTFPQNLFMTAGPVLGFCVAHYVKDTVQRQDAHIREVIAMIAKAENCLGLDNKVEVRGVGQKAELWPRDASFVIDRWVEARMESGESSEDFIAKEGTGTFRNLRRVFTLIQVISVLLLAGILVVPFIS
jgi:hypothetical protein